MPPRRGVIRRQLRRAWFDYTAIDDGGAGYWRIQYDVATCRFLDFDVNADG